MRNNYHTRPKKAEAQAVRYFLREGYTPDEARRAAPLALNLADVGEAEIGNPVKYRHR